MNAINLMAQFAARENEAMRASWRDDEKKKSFAYGEGRAPRMSCAINADRIRIAVYANPGLSQFELLRLMSMSQPQWKKAYPSLRQSGIIVCRRRADGPARYYPGGDA
jgi:hypothetical protein